MQRVVKTRRARAWTGVALLAADASVTLPVDFYTWMHASCMIGMIPCHFCNT